MRHICFICVTCAISLFMYLYHYPQSRVGCSVLISSFIVREHSSKNPHFSISLISRTKYQQQHNRFERVLWLFSVAHTPCPVCLFLMYSHIFRHGYFDRPCLAACRTMLLLSGLISLAYLGLGFRNWSHLLCKDEN